jgi:hypothetical protein
MARSQPIAIQCANLEANCNLARLMRYSVGVWEIGEMRKFVPVMVAIQLAACARIERLHRQLLPLS